MIRVCHLITSMATGGAETALYRLLTHADRQRFAMTAVSLTDGGTYGPMLSAAGIPVHTLDMRRGRLSLGAFARLVALLRREKPDILQTWLYHSDLIGTAAAPFCGSPPLLWNIRCSVTDARYVKGQAGAVVRLLARLSRRPRLIISNSEAGRIVHTALGYHPRAWEIVPNGVDTRMFAPDTEARRAVRNELGLPRDAVLVGLVARFDPLKDHATFLQAAARVIAKRAEVHFVAVGSGVSRGNPELDQLSADLGLAGNLHLLGERRDIPRLNAAFDIATCSSLGEGFPNVLIEAMACATPCISTDAGDSELVLGDTGLIVPPADPEAFADAILRLVDAGWDERVRLGQAARTRAQELYSLDTMVARYQALYAGIAEANTTRAGTASPP